MAEETTNSGYGYGKRPMWQWILLYVVVGGIVYALVYYFVLAKKNGYGNSMYPATTTAPTQTSTAMTPSENIYKTMTDATKGSYMTDFNGMTLYIYDKDKPGVSNCYNGCAVAWPPYTSGATAQSKLPENITVITRTDGTKQFAWKQWPLYYYQTDAKAGDVTGDGVGGVWHIVKP